ncbi:MAG TPA: hypothetical protein VNZ86_15730 [Bacteroidia bacterium]|jgi:hypothetical protein|nr:hypothetical protein [Bacteroidia bacterium]
MKHNFLLLFVLAFCISPVIRGQQFGTFLIKDKAGISDITPYVKAIQSADMTSDRYLDKRRTFKFTSGVEVELLSANELIAQGIKVDTDRLCTLKTGDPGPVYTLSASGYILKGFPSHGKVSKN